MSIHTAETLTVTVSTSSTEYLAATSLTLTCNLIIGSEAVEPFTYQWSSTCSGECFVDGQTTAVIMQSALRSIDSGTHTCTVTDDVGNSGSASIDIAVVGTLVIVLL